MSDTRSIATTNPATGDVVIDFDSFTDERVDDLVRAADTAFRDWRTVPVVERAAVIARAGELLLERKDEFAPLLTLEMGKLIAEAEFEVDLAASIFAYYAEHGADMLADETIDVDQGSATVQTRPIGVLLGVMPWNFPLYQVARFAAPNIVAGNVIALKHASICPQTSIALEKLMSDAGSPDGVYTNLLVPGGSIARIVENPIIRGASLTGSEAAGASVSEVAGRNLKKSVLELGGSDPMVILDTRDVARSVKAAVTGRMANTGQSCIAAKRLIVLDEIYDDFVAALVDQMGQLTPGDPQDPETTLGPLSSESAAKTLAEQVSKAIAQGAKALLGGERVDRDGAYMQATVLTEVTEDMDVFRDELFGPVAVVYRVADEAEAISIANDTDFGLGASVLSSDAEQAARVAEALEAGMVWLNHPTSTAAHLPFGGVKRSGFGRELSHLGMSEFVNKKLIRSFPADAEISMAAG